MSISVPPPPTRVKIPAQKSAPPPPSRAALPLPERVEKIQAKVKAAKDPTLHQQQAPIGYHLRGVSTLIGADGEVKQTWLKTARDKVDPAELLEIFKEAVLLDPPPVKAPVEASSGALDKARACIYPMGDPHIGMLAWGKETGAAFDLEIAERHLLHAVDKLVQLAPQTERAFVLNLGDFFHADNMDARTWRSGHKLDVDSRWAKVLRLGVQIMVRIIDRALEKHAHVTVVNEIGNHDDHSAVMLSVCLSHHYLSNPRVEIDMSPAHYHYFEFGQNLIGVHHGHESKAKALAEIMAADRPEAWGRTRFRYWYTGHVHHESKHELRGCIVESFRTLAAADAYAASAGYRSGRSMVCDVLHHDFGRVCRHEIGVEQLSALA